MALFSGTLFLKMIYLFLNLNKPGVSVIKVCYLNSFQSNESFYI